MGHSLCLFILRQIPRRSPTRSAVYFTATRLGRYNIVTGGHFSNTSKSVPLFVQVR